MTSLDALQDYLLNLQLQFAPLLHKQNSLLTAVLAVFVFMATWLITRPFNWRFDSNRLTPRLMANLVFPLASLFGFVTCCVIAHFTKLFNLELLIYLMALSAIYALVRSANVLISYSLAKKHYVTRLNNSLSWLLFAVIVITATDTNHNIVNILDNLTLTVGKTFKISLWDFLTGCATVVVAFILAMLANRFSERKINQLSGIDNNLQQILIRLTKIFIFILTALITLPLIGIDMTILSVFGGAIGVGIGFGLQKIASNFLSGFIILLDRSIRVGDRLIVDNNAGSVTKITTRYVVLERADGTDVLIPNEKFVTDSIQNQSYSNSNLRVELTFSLSDQAEIESAIQLIKESMTKIPNALPIEPSVIINKLIPGGLEVKAYYWVEKAADIASTTNHVYISVLHKFKQANIQGPQSTQQIEIVKYETSS